MASNQFGQLFKITTWGESHGKAIGVVIDGCPAGLKISAEEIDKELSLRAPGKRTHTSPRKEADQVEIFSGVFEGVTTGAPISLILFNRDAKSDQYESIKEVYRPGHANFTYLEKYGIFDYRGGGRASARETACRVAAGAVAKKLLKHFGIEVVAYLKAVGEAEVQGPYFSNSTDLIEARSKSDIFCPEPSADSAMRFILSATEKAGDSLGGVVEFIAFNLPVGLGDPVYEKLEANLARAMMGLPATKGFEIGSGFAASKMVGSVHNDPFEKDPSGPKMTTNNAGGTLGGISTGMPLVARVAFKPTSSIKIPQKTVNLKGEEVEFMIPEGGRHDPCVAIRAVPVVEAMAALVLADAVLMNRSARL